jgi:hypothetical protein
MNILGKLSNNQFLSVVFSTITGRRYIFFKFHLLSLAICRESQVRNSLPEGRCNFGQKMALLPVFKWEFMSVV